MNRIVFHTSDHQPFTDDKHKPGITLGYFGQHYTRNITWAEQAIAWNKYLARCSYMEQLGHSVVDIAYFYGESAPVTVPYWKHFSPSLPSGFSRDYVNSDIVLNHATVDGRDLTLTSGMHYRVLVVPDEFDQLSVALVRRISELVKAGATVLAPRVKISPSLADNGRSSELPALALALWGSDTAAHGSHNFGRGKIYWGTPLESVLADEHVDPDFTFDSPKNVVPYDYPSPRRPQRRSYGIIAAIQEATFTLSRISACARKTLPCTSALRGSQLSCGTPRPARSSQWTLLQRATKQRVRSISLPRNPSSLFFTTGLRRPKRKIRPSERIC